MSRLNIKKNLTFVLARSSTESSHVIHVRRDEKATPQVRVSHLWRLVNDE